MNGENKVSGKAGVHARGSAGPSARQASVDRPSMGERVTMESISAGQLYAAHRRPLLAFIRHHAPADVEAEDLLHEVFLRVVRQQRSGTVMHDPRAWLYRAARRLLIDRYRRPYVLETLPEDLAEDSQRLTPGQELAQCLTPLLNELDEPYRSALHGADFERTPLKQLAECQGLSLSGMKSRVQRARRQMQRALLRCCELKLNANGAIDDYRVKDPAASPCAAWQCAAPGSVIPWLGGGVGQ